MSLAGNSVLFCTIAFEKDAVFIKCTSSNSQSNLNCQRINAYVLPCQSEPFSPHRSIYSITSCSFLNNPNRANICSKLQPLQSNNNKTLHLPSFFFYPRFQSNPILGKMTLLFCCGHKIMALGKLDAFVLKEINFLTAMYDQHVTAIKQIIMVKHK